jgi:hypothetical protein
MMTVDEIVLWAVIAVWAIMVYLTQCDYCLTF